MLIGLQGERDYDILPWGTPAWKGNHALGHSLVVDEPDAGPPGIVGRHILQWMLRGQPGAKRWFTSGKGPEAAGMVDVESKHLEAVQEVGPI